MRESSYIMYPEKHFAVVRFKTKDINLKEIIKINTAYKNDENYSNIHYLVMILLGSNPRFKESDLDKVIQEYTQNPQKNNHIRSVFVVDTPKTTAFAHLMISHTPEQAFYCATLEKAYEYLSPPFSYSEFLEKVQS